VIELHADANFPLEALLEVRGDLVGANDLDGHRVAVHHIVPGQGFVDGGHAARAEKLGDLVAAQLLPSSGSTGVSRTVSAVSTSGGA